ncbi:MULTISPECIES: hypothetical protein [Falsihalocynthiibacter]|uniref:hypothetical protein n=1 Tax=Falsihalocynthiibacter TaxID=2854182 RepID=UPI00300220AD
MYKFLLFCSALTLSACATGTPPFGGNGSDEDSGASVSATEVYVGDEGDMNNLVYDAVNDELVINNLPFDSVDGRYVNTGGTFLDGFQVYASKQTGETGRFQYYAVHATSANGHAGAVGTAAYRNYGHGGAMIARNTNNVNLPVGRGQLLYTGSYAGIRVADDVPGSVTGVTFADGDARLYVDLLDFDVTGAVAGFVENRNEYDVNGTYIGSLQSIVLNETADITTGGVINGTSTTYDTGSSGTQEVLQSGNYTAIFAGRNGEQIIGTVRITGDIDINDSDLGNVQETGVFVVTD